jgi:hypothetical protein
VSDVKAHGGPEERRRPNGTYADRADPTKNVRELVDASILRLDDLRIAGERTLIREAALRAEYEDKLRKAETARIDAIRAVDVGAVNRAAEVAATAATTLAAQVDVSAETLRNQVAAAASAQTVALAAALEPVQKDIADLRRAQYEAQGQKTQVVETQARGASSGLWIGIAIAAFVGITGFMLTVAGIAITYLATR